MRLVPIWEGRDYDDMDIAQEEDVLFSIALSGFEMERLPLCHLASDKTTLVDKLLFSMHPTFLSECFPAVDFVESVQDFSFIDPQLDICKLLTFAQHG